MKLEAKQRLKATQNLSQQERASMVSEILKKMKKHYSRPETSQMESGIF
jgi:hypothetical protein